MAWWWRSRESWRWAGPWASRAKTRSACCVARDGHSAASVAMCVRNSVCPNNCCWRQRFSQLLASLDAAVERLEVSRNSCPACRCKDPRACCRVIVRPISTTANTSSHTRLRVPASRSTRRWVMVLRVGRKKRNAPSWHTQRTGLWIQVVQAHQGTGHNLMVGIGRCNATVSIAVDSMNTRAIGLFLSTAQLQSGQVRSTSPLNE